VKPNRRRCGLFAASQVLVEGSELSPNDLIPSRCLIMLRTKNLSQLELSKRSPDLQLFSKRGVGKQMGFSGC
jgi:hypothetical protein